MERLSLVPTGGTGASGSAPQTGQARTLAPKRFRVSRGEVDHALALVAQAYPELNTAMQLARAMLCRLDTIRDEAKLGACIARSGYSKGDPTVAARTMDNVIGLLGSWDDRHDLEL